ncbi:hypothetical protein [uncultured Ilyobacter sp.]|nr:hypothetical protein [uncultured Ilyobacter sp.]
MLLRAGRSITDPPVGVLPKLPGLCLDLRLRLLGMGLVGFVSREIKKSPV